MKYNIEFSKKAEKNLTRLEHTDIEKILFKLQEVRKEPINYIERIKGLKLWKLRVGDYRLILTIDIKKKIIFIADLGHRKNIYKKIDKLK